MNFIKITDEFVTLHDEPYKDITLYHGKTYLIHSAHANAIASLKLGRIVEGVEKLPHLPKSCLKNHSRPLKVLFLFDGGMGDAISLAILLKKLEDSYNLSIHIACNRAIWRDILKPLGFSGDWHQLPVEASVIDQHDYIQIRADEEFKDRPDKWNLCIVEELGSAFKVDLAHPNLLYSIPPEITETTILSQKSSVRIGLNFDSRGRIRSYPEVLQPSLTDLLLQTGIDVFIFGKESPDLEGLEMKDNIHDYCGKTTVPELASMIRQMDLMICMDSFIAHLSNILGVKTIVLLSTTRKGVYSWHKNISCLESKIECSPCGEVGDVCPRGLKQCQAFFHGSTTPEIIISLAIQECATHFTRLIRASIGR